MDLLRKIKEKLNITNRDITNVKEFIESTSSKASLIANEKLSKGYNSAHEKTFEIIIDYRKSREPLTNKNWYIKAANSCENMSDAFMRESDGTSTKITKGIIGKLGAAGTSVGIFSLASLVGTASTGTTIGSLSGAAFSSASLAWLGGSMFMGSIIIGVASIAGGIGAVLGAGWLFKKYVYGKKRDRAELEVKEQRIIDVCLSLATAYRQKSEDGMPIGSFVAQAMYRDALEPLCDELQQCKLDGENWTTYAKKRFNDALGKLTKVTNHLKEHSTNNPNIPIGIISSVVLQLLSEGPSAFNSNEELVLEALRRSNNKLHDASIEDLSTYIQEMSPEGIAGLTNNIKGIYHELKFVDLENSDGDSYIAELFEETNHAGADVRIINTVTGDIQEIQLKATDYLSYVQRHNERYEDIEVFVTSEVADASESLESTNISNSEITKDVNGTFDKLDGLTQSHLTSSMTVAALISLARNSNVLLRGDSLSQSDK